LVFFVLFCIFLDCVATAFSLTKQLAMAEEEEPVDMKEVYEEACKPKCGKVRSKLRDLISLSPYHRIVVGFEDGVSRHFEPGSVENRVV